MRWMACAFLAGIGGTAIVQRDFPKVSLRSQYEWFDTESNVELWTAGVGMIFRL